MKIEKVTTEASNKQENNAIINETFLIVSLLKCLHKNILIWCVKAVSIFDRDFIFI